jgi:uncharacterized protein (TIGR03000 family)
MYGFILMAALGGSSATPSWGGPFYGCCGVPVASGCFSSGCYGGMPVSFGCWGNMPAGGCYGALPAGYGCQGSLWMTYGYAGCFGVPLSPGGYGAMPGRYRPYYGTPEGTPAAPEVQGTVTRQTRETSPASPEPAPPPRQTGSVKVAAPAPADSREGPSGTKPKTELIGPPQDSAGSSRATLVVQLPSEARLTINGATSQMTSGTRTFQSPPLRRGEDYSYTLQAEWVRDGQTVTTGKHVTVRAGEERKVTLTFPSTADRGPR